MLRILPTTFAVGKKGDPDAGESMRRKHGFTLIELLVVVVIIGVLMGLLLPAILKFKGSATAKRNDAQIRALGAAIDAYVLAYHRLPAPGGDFGRDKDYYYGPADDDLDAESSAVEYRGKNSLVVDELVAADPPVMKPDAFRINGDGEVLDPWGNPYRFIMDLNDDKWLDCDGNGNESTDEYVHYRVTNEE
jgi:prepilin-type N-terminal cleavage/methylation domain-containing protein